ncbi:MAG TPA: lamin tail domain-containing protein, partial [Planctomycetota bacterium]|nr:lamin tail domain-containing protein [Planctomycetota bacterium]
MRNVVWCSRIFRPGLLLALLVASPGLDAAPWLVITEVHYNDPEGGAGEFVEVYSKEPPRAEISGWSLDGEVRYRFPEGTVIYPGEHIVIARDPARLRARHPGARRVFGPFKGQLDRKGGRLSLRNAAGGIACEVRYDSDGKWPSTPDGTGHTLSILDPNLDPGDPRCWAPSARIGGTPGAPNFPRSESAGVPIVRKGDVWRYLRGRRAPGAGWRDPSFDDKEWESGPGGLGYGDGDDATEILDMRGNYVSLYARRAFQPAGALSLERLVLRVDYDDGFIAYLNGKEAARANMGPEGEEAAHDQFAAGLHEAGVPAEFDLGPASKWLRPGKNVLAIQVHNGDLSSSDLSLAVDLESREAPSSAAGAARPLLNEVAFGKSDEAFVEVYNAGTAPVDLGGHSLLLDAKEPRRFKIPSPSPLAPRAFLVLRAKDLGEGFAIPGPEAFIALVEPKGDRVLDCLRLKALRAAGDEPPKARGKAGKKGEGKGKTKAGEKGAEKTPPGEDEARASPHPLARNPRGRFPDGSSDIAVLEAPTPGSANRMPRVDDLVFSEIQYHPITGDEKDEFIEIHNRGGAEISLSGFRITGGVRFQFERGRTIPAGGWVVVAKDPTALRKKYGLAEKVVAGPFEGMLSNRGEELVLRDAWGNIADRVDYRDGSPWPIEADGLGSSLELVHPALDNSLAASWAPSNNRSAAEWDVFSYSKEHRPFEGRNIAEFQLLLLNKGECLVDDVRVSGVLEEGFERGASGWMGLGTHERSGVARDAGEGRKGCYRIVADGRGNARQNYVTKELPGLEPGKRYRVSFRAKWQSGCPILLTRTPGQGVSLAHELSPPERLGTPGAANSRHSPVAPPSVGVPVQTPVAPLANEPVAFSVRISGRVGVKEASILYRQDGTVEWRSTPLADDGIGKDGVAGDGVWSGEVPGFPAGKVEFHVSATDADGIVGTFPAGAPERPAIYAAGIMPSQKFPTYTLIVSEAEWRAFGKRPRLSNRLTRATLVYDNSRIFYDVGLRRRGSPFTRSSRNWRVVLGAETIDGRSTLTLDGQGGDGTRLNERLTYWCVEALRLPNPRQQYVHFRLLGREEGIYEDVEKIDGSFLARWFEPSGEDAAESAARGKSGARARRPSLHKIDDYWEISAGGEQSYREADFRFTSPDPEDYRWNFPERGNSADEDPVPLVKLVQFLDPRATPDRAFDDRADKVLDVDEWLRMLAARTIADDWDAMGRARGKNAFLYLPPTDGLWRLLAWDCDLAWQQNPRSALFPNKFSSIQRLLSRPLNRRRYLGYLAYLATRKLESAFLTKTLTDLNARTNAATDAYYTFAQTRRQFVLVQVPRIPFQVKDVRRVNRSREPDVVRAAGTGAPIVMRLRLNGREGNVRLVAEELWTAEFPVGPEGG